MGTKRTGLPRWTFPMFPMAAAVATALLPSAGRAEDDTTNIIDGTVYVHDNGGATLTNYNVGYLGTNNHLLIRNGGVLTNVAGFIYVGVSNTARGNSILVTDPGSAMYTDYRIYVGNYGPDCSVTVSNGGYVFASNQIYIGTFTGAENTRVLVTGSGSLWRSASTTLGNYTSSNRLTVADGGRYEVAGSVSIASQVNRGGNLLQVTGPGSVLVASGNMTFGNVGIGNRVSVDSGGVMTNGAAAYIGSRPSSTGNVVRVAGPGSAWWIGSNLRVGWTGVNNRLVVEDGGLVSSSINSSGDAHVGELFGASNNHALVTGSGSVWSNNGAIYLGSKGQFNGLSISNGGRVVSSSAYAGYAVGSSGGNPSMGTATGAWNYIVIEGADSTWEVTGRAIVGTSGSFNWMTVSNGGRFAVDPSSAQDSVVGFYAGANSNLLTITGAGSAVDMGGRTLHAGLNSAATGNVINIFDGGSVLQALSVRANGSNPRINLGNGAGNAVIEAQVVDVVSTTARLTIDRGTVIARTSDTNLVQGAGSVFIGNGGATFDTAGHTVSITNDLRNGGAGGLTKAGTGTLILSGTNSYAGPTVVSNGTLRVNGVHNGGGLITVVTGAVLAGAGEAGDVRIESGGALAPGASIGTLRAEDVTLDGGAVLAWELDADGTTCDRLALTGALSRGSGAGIVFDFQGTGAAGSYTLIQFGSTDLTDGDFGYRNLADGLTGTIDVSEFNDVTLTVVPEPATMSLVGLAVLLAFLRRRTGAGAGNEASCTNRDDSNR